MPLRDHFHPPLTLRYGWSQLHGGWPMKIVEQLNTHLPPEYRAAPTVYASGFEVDIGAFDERERPEWGDSPGGGGTALYTSAKPTLTLDGDPLDADEFEVKVYRDDNLVAAIELVSPSNEDRPETRDIFTAKCAALLKRGVCVSIVDIVTSSRANLFDGLLHKLGWPDRTAEDGIYVATLRDRRIGSRRRLDTWYYPIAVGRPLPTLPLWIDENLAVPLELDASYEATCRAIRLR